jgi:hypothetical protein
MLFKKMGAIANPRKYALMMDTFPSVKDTRSSELQWAVVNTRMIPETSAEGRLH